MSELKEIIEAIIKFRDDRDWEQFHDSKNLAIALSIEASELNELYLWKNRSNDIANISKERFSEELADIFIYAFLLAEKNDLDVKEIIMNKIKQNANKYPISKAKGTSKKYTEL
jgi:NTP pyrophosphatase (non-canonical NTP hydrolase)